MRISIADASGANEVWLDGAEGPAQFPEPVAERLVELHTMRPGQTAAGRRTVDDLGVHVSYPDLQWESRYLAPATHAAIKLKYEAWPPVSVVVKIVDASATVRYLCAWAADGYVPERWTVDADTRRRAKFHLHVLDTL